MAIDFPNSPSVNDQYTVGDRTWTWNGTYWQTSTSMSTFTASDSEPVDADAGDIWFDSTIGKTFVNYDGNWVEIGAAGSVVDVIADSDGDTKVQVESSADEDKIRFSTAGTERVIVDASGSVGIGTASPDRGLHVDSPTAAVSAKFTSQHASLGLVELADSSSTATSQIGTNGDDIVFRPIQTERMRIDSSGNVGIGTTSPSDALDLADGSIRFGEDSSGNALGGPFGIKVYSHDTTGNPVSFESALYYRTTPNAWSFEDSLGNDILCIDIANDRVGVGTDSPSVPLDVTGKIHATSYIRAGYGDGGVALTHNDGGGNANVTFNHVDKIPEQDGNSARIQVNVDSSTGARMLFELAQGVTGGQSVTTSEIMRLDTVGIDVYGNITATGTVTGGSSDERLKTVSGTVSNALEKLSGIRGYYYTLNETAESLGLPQIGESQVGVLAQEVMAVMPELVTIAPISERDEVEEEYYTVRYERFAPLLIEAIHEQQVIIETLTARIEALEAG